MEELLEDKGFELVENETEQTLVRRVYKKEYSKIENVAWYGPTETKFQVYITFVFDQETLRTIRADYSNGKTKYYDTLSWKRAINGIRDTVKYNGFEL